MTPEEAYKEILKLKELLWLRHGCPFHALYGDDGEMQCSACSIDFKRMTATQLEEYFRNVGKQEFCLEVNLNGVTKADSCLP